MDKEDARYQKLEQLHERRKQVVRLHRKGHGVMAIVGMTGLSYPAVRLAIDLYEEGGYAAVKPAPRGRESGEGRTLTAEQEDAIRRTICDKRPEQLKMEFALWRRAAVMQLIERDMASSFRCAVSATICLAGASPHRSQSRRLMSSDRKPYKPGSMSNTRKLRSAPKQKEARFTGAMKQRWSIPMCVVVATHRPARPQSPHRGRYPAEVVDDCHGNKPGQDPLDDH